MRLRLFSFYLLCLPLFVSAGDEPLLRYRVLIRGLEDRDLRKELRAVSVMEELRSRPPHSELQLRRRAQRDPPRFETLLRNQGFYASKIETEFQLERRRPRVVFHIDTGPAFLLRTIALQTADGDSLPYVIPLESLGLVPGAPARADRLRAAEDLLLTSLRRRGYPFPELIRMEVRVYHSDQAVDVVYVVNPGGTFRFAATQVYGLRRVEEEFVRRNVPWNDGDLYNSDQVRLFRQRLAASNLFNVIQIQAGLPEQGEDTVPMRVDLQERRHRSVTFGVGYFNDEGWRGRTGWEHRNIRNLGQRLAFEAAVSDITRFGELSFRFPGFRHLDQSLTLSARHTEEDTLAFESRKSDLLAAVDRPLSHSWHGSIGLGSRASRVEDAREIEEYRFLFLPVRLDRDRSDHPLDPRRGHRLSLGVAPYWGPADENLFFLKSRASFTYYRPLLSRPLRLDSASRISYALTTGASRDSIPADERLYAGGGATLRGYKFQTVGPLEDGEPVGGRSMILLGQELRWRLNEQLGLTAFLDGGTVTEEAVFDSGVDEFRWGAGLGLRYFTPVGPFRIDIAFPLNRRDIDDTWQFYISLGQAF